MRKHEIDLLDTLGQRPAETVNITLSWPADVNGQRRTVTLVASSVCRGIQFTPREPCVVEPDPGAIDALIDCALQEVTVSDA